MADKIDSEERERLLYVTQILHLDKQLERCQHKCDELEKQNKVLASQCSMLEEDTRDITEYLKYSLVENEKRVDELAEQLESQQQAIEQDREALKLQHSQQIQELQEQLDKLNPVTTMQVAKCEEQKGQLMQQLSYIQSLKKQLISQQSEHEAAFQSTIAETDQNRQKLTEVQKIVDDRIKSKTSNIVQEERAQYSERSKQLHFLLNENLDLMEVKDTLQDTLEDTEKSLRSEMDKIREARKKESIIREKVKQLRMWCQQLEEKLKKCNITHEHMLAKEEDLRQNLASASEECHQKTAEVSQIEPQLQRERNRRRQLERVMWEAVTILRHIVMESGQASDTQWKKQRLQEVLEILDSKEPDFTVSVSTEKSNQEQKPHTTDPKLARAETLNLSTDPMFLLLRYRPGDLGFVPHPPWKHIPAISTSTQMPPTRKFCSWKSSVDPSPPAPQSD